MGIHSDDLLEYVINPTLAQLGGLFESAAAARLLLGTAIQESFCGRYLRQLGGGPALGIYQMEPATHDDLWMNFIMHRGTLRALVEDVCGLRALPVAPERLVYDLRYATVMARLQYWRVAQPLPQADDLDGLATYWKDHYNTHLGAGTVAEYLHNFHRFTR